MSRKADAGQACVCGEEHLTTREIDVMLLIAEELADADIAAKLNLSVSTVQRHVKNIRRKAHTKSKAGVITRAFAAGVLLPGTLPPRWSGVFCLYVAPVGRRRTARKPPAVAAGRASGRPSGE